MTLRHIEIFAMVCREGSITRAAERLYLSQPTVSAAINYLSLSPSVAGFGYKAAFLSDDTVNTLLDNLGYSLWITEDVVVNRTVSGFKDQISLRLKNFDIENFGSAKVNAKVYMQLNNGLRVESQVVSYSMQDMIEMISADLTKYDATQIQSVKTMLEGYAAIESWNIQELLAWKQDA